MDILMNSKMVKDMLITNKDFLMENQVKVAEEDDMSICISCDDSGFVVSILDENNDLVECWEELAFDEVLLAVEESMDSIESLRVPTVYLHEFSEKFDKLLQEIGIPENLYEDLQNDFISSLEYVGIKIV